MKKIRRKRKHKTRVDSEGTWAISYGDMVTLLLAFFVMFFTVNPDREAEEQLKNSLVATLKSERSPASESTATMLNFGSVSGQDIDQRAVQKFGAPVYTVGQRILVDFKGTNFFHLGNTDVNSEGQTALDQFVNLYLPYAGHYTLGIRAYTDSRKVKSTTLKYRDNLELSALRSVSAMRYLRDKGVPMDRMRLGGYGELRVTHDHLKKLAEEKGVKDYQSFARKIVLVIEPDEKRKKEEGA